MNEKQFYHELIGSHGGRILWATQFVHGEGATIKITCWKVGIRQLVIVNLDQSTLIFYPESSVTGSDNSLKWEESLKLITEKVFNTAPVHKPTFDVTSSHGTIIAEKATGKVVKMNLNCDCHTTGEACINRIVRFDVIEWCLAWEEKEMADSVDILDLGYWDKPKKQEVYVEPAHDWRQEFRQQQQFD